MWGLKFILNVGIREAHFFGDNAAALIQFLRCKAGVGRVYRQRLLKSFRYQWASCPGFTVYCHWVRGTANPADPISRLHDQFDGDLAMAREAATRRVGDLWAFPDCKTFFYGLWEFLWVLLCSRRHDDPASVHMRLGRGGAEFHEVFLQCRLEESVGAMT